MIKIFWRIMLKNNAEIGFRPAYDGSEETERPRAYEPEQKMSQILIIGQNASPHQIGIYF